MLKKVAFLLFVFGVFVVMHSANAYIEKDTAVVRIMNKAAGKTQTVKIPVGRPAEFEKLLITVQTCKQTDPFQAENFHAFIEISTVSNGQIFGGWMNRNEPGDNPLQNADYDLWLVQCE